MAFTTPAQDLARITASKNNYVSTNPSVNAYATSTKKSTPKATLGSSTSSSSSSAPAQQSSSSNQPPLEQAQAFSPPNFDELIAPAIQAYEGYIWTLQGQLPGTLEGIDKDLATKTASLKSSIDTQSRSMGTAKEKQGVEEESAANEARRIYNEIQQGLQARYGGTTGTGAFATELAGGQTSRNIANIRTTGAQLIKELDDKLFEVQEIGRITQQDIQTQAENQKREAKNNLENQIAEIRSKIGETQSNKAQLYANAYQNYQSYVQGVDSRNASFQQQLYSQQKAAEQTLEAAKLKASTVGSSAKPTSLKYISTTDPIYSFDPTTGETVLQSGSGPLGSEESNYSTGDAELDKLLEAQ